MMFMHGVNELVLNRATLNAIISQWYNTHAHMEEGKTMLCEFSRYDNHVFTFNIKENENENT